MKDKEEADLILEFQNLTHLELGYSDYTRDWIEGLEVIKRCRHFTFLSPLSPFVHSVTRGVEEGFMEAILKWRITFI